MTEFLVHAGLIISIGAAFWGLIKLIEIGNSDDDWPGGAAA